MDFRQSQMRKADAQAPPLRLSAAPRDLLCEPTPRQLAQ